MTNIKQAKHRSRAPISVIIPCYQAEKTLIRAFKSILEQSLQVSEIIIIDDGCTDNTLRVARQIALKYKGLISIIHFDLNKGVSEARNAGWNRASYQYIAFLDADDVWHPRKIEIQYNFFISNPGYDLVGHEHQIKVSTSEAFDTLPLNFKSISIGRLKMLFFTPFAVPTVMIKKKIPYRFNAKMRYAEDYLLWLQIVFSGKEACKIFLSLAATFKPNYGASGLSANMIEMEKGIHQAYKNLYREHLISKITLIFFIFFSSLKFLRRLLILNIKILFKFGN